MWIKLQMKNTQQLNNERYTDFKVEVSGKYPEASLENVFFMGPIQIPNCG
jgi:hypothetical protein